MKRQRQLRVRFRELVITTHTIKPSLCENDNDESSATNITDGLWYRPEDYHRFKQLFPIESQNVVNSNPGFTPSSKKNGNSIQNAYETIHSETASIMGTNKCTRNFNLQVEILSCTIVWRSSDWRDILIERCILTNFNGNGGSSRQFEVFNPFTKHTALDDSSQMRKMTTMMKRPGQSACCAKK